MSEGVHGVGGNVLDVFVELAAESLHEVADEEGEIFGTLAECRNLDGENVQAIVEVAAKRRARRRAGKDRCWWRRRHGRQLVGCDCRRGVRIPALEGRGEVSVEVQGEGRRLRLGKECRGRRVRTGRFFD